MVFSGCGQNDTKKAINEIQLTKKIKPQDTRDSAFINELMGFLTPYITDSIFHLEWNKSLSDTLFGLPVSDILYGPENSQNSDHFYHYNTKLLAKIDAALDFSPINNIVKNLKNFQLADNNSGISFYFENGIDTSISTGSVAGLLISRLHLKKYPEELRKYRKRYKRFLLDDSNEFSPCSLDVSPHLNSVQVAFWIRRSLDGSDTLIESILTKIVRLSNPAVYNKIFGRNDQMSGQEKSGDDMVFTYDSYCDEEDLGIQPSLLECRDDILYGFSARLDSIIDLGQRSNGTLVIDGIEAEAVLTNTTCNGKFLRKNNYFALVEDSDKKIEWIKVNPAFTLTFQTYPEPCMGNDEARLFWAVMLSIGIQGNTVTPLLFTAFPQNSTRKPGMVFRPDSITEPYSREPTDTAAYTRKLTYNIPPELSFIKGLCRVDSIQYIGGEVSRMGILSSALKIQWSDGLEQILHEEKGYGGYSFIDGIISDLILTDINGDGMSDICFSSAEKGKWVIFIQKDNSFKKRQIKKPIERAVGGC